MDVGRSPLPENIAASIVSGASVQSGVIWDGFCGSGSLLIGAIYTMLKLPVRLN